jgi:uncharacterized protein YecE (DUF72 family)
MRKGLNPPPLYIGTSGWNYDHWRNDFYRGVRRKEWLAHCADRFSGIEINSTFYRLQTVDTFARWRDETPANFRFAIKGNRFLTHNKKLNDPRPAIALERERAQGLGNKLAAVLWQLPGNFHSHLDRLEQFAQALDSWSNVRHAIEFRHASWFSDEVADCLGRHRIAACQSDAADWPMWDAVTTDMVYVRLHGHSRTYASSYSRATLQRWAARIGEWRAQGRTVHVYFDNDAEGAAPGDALRLMEYAGLTPRAKK